MERKQIYIVWSKLGYVFLHYGNFLPWGFFLIILYIYPRKIIVMATLWELVHCIYVLAKIVVVVLILLCFNIGIIKVVIVINPTWIIVISQQLYYSKFMYQLCSIILVFQRSTTVLAIVKQLYHIVHFD